MKHIVRQIFLGLSGILMLFRFGTPALIFGATGPGPFGNRWLAPGTTATLLLDSDLQRPNQEYGRTAKQNGVLDTNG